MKSFYEVIHYFNEYGCPDIQDSRIFWCIEPAVNFMNELKREVEDYYTGENELSENEHSIVLFEIRPNNDENKTCTRKDLRLVEVRNPMPEEELRRRIEKEDKELIEYWTNKHEED